ncbi:hypothetical protein EZJ19_04345 [Parasulfuritortus cantonensis]|uniref:Pierisin-like domain-containing protein n=1 Tax=Parasulfuritortus cantonensis TaxID=2528202 RepID=A0A4R1BJ39_9PROT|nr:hypothetical protein [Parasulfuritortus cantonensis]TCJ17188.1 hypothetical protein EZJ19_04345 [Parasulfuritortus cantonensis]
MSFKKKLTQGVHRYIEFGEYDPEGKYAGEEQEGNMSWSGGTLGYINSKSKLPMLPLPPAMQKMLDHAWTAASPAAGASRSGVQMGGHRQGVAVKQPAPGYQKINTPAIIAKADQGFHNSQVASGATHLKSTFATDWALHKGFDRVRAFTFRGDKRDPLAIKNAGGFKPPITRTDDWYVENVVYKQFSRWLKDRAGMDITWPQFRDAIQKSIPDQTMKQAVWHYGTWRMMVDLEQFHLGRMLAEEAMKGFISTTRAVTVAKGYASNSSTAGWVYVTRIDGGYVVPDQAKHQWTTIFGEQEIAMPGAVTWENVMGFRQVTKGAFPKFTGPIYLRDHFVSEEKDAAEKVYKLLSGKKQA